jgi:hypothetical protein
MRLPCLLRAALLSPLPAFAKKFRGDPVLRKRMETSPLAAAAPRLAGLDARRHDVLAIAADHARPPLRPIVER